VAGLIIVPVQGDLSFLIDANRHSRVPIVFVDRPAAGVEADVVLFDNEGGGRLATAHLVKHGHRRIAVLVAPSFYTTGRRLRGYRRALREAGIPAEDRLIVNLRQGTAEEAAAATRNLLASADPPTAVFATTNFLTEGVLRAAQPHRIAVVGFDDFRFSDMLPTPVTVVASDTEELGRLAARHLLDRVNGDNGPFRRTILPVQLIPRGSGETKVSKATRA
jgi:LacI family transcriptional regulator